MLHERNSNMKFDKDVSPEFREVEDILFLGYFIH